MIKKEKNMASSDSIQTGKPLAYVLFVAAAVAAVLGAIGIIDQNIMTLIMSVTGFGGIAALRAFIDSAGIKTYVLIGGAAVAVGLHLLKVITLPILQSILAVVFSLCGTTLTAATTKAQE
jgi:hypothetical protein